MNDASKTSEHFKDADPLTIASVRAELCDPEDEIGATILRVIESPSDVDETFEVYLEVHEARALRDWLNKVIP